MKSMKKNYIYNVILKTVDMLFSLLLYPYVTRVIGPSFLGKVNYADSVVGYFVFIAQFGVALYAIRQIAQYRDDKEIFSEKVSELFTVNLCCIVCALVLFVGVFFIPVLKEYRVLLLIYGTLIFANPLSINWVFDIKEEYEYIAVRYLAIRIVYVILILAFVRNDDDYILYAVFNVGITVVTMVVNLLHAKTFVEIKIKFSPQILIHIKPMFWIFGSLLASNIFLNADITILGILKGDRDVGLYSVVVRVSRLINGFIAAINTTVIARASYLLKNGEREKYIYLVKKATQFILIVSIPSAMGLIALSEPIIFTLFGEKYVESINLLRWIAFNCVVSPLSGLVVHQIMIPHNHEKESFYVSCISSFVNVVLNIAFIPLFGTKVAAITTIVSELICIICSGWIVRREVKILELFRGFWQYIISGSVMMLVVGIEVILIRNNVARLIIGIGSGCLVYFGLLIIMKNTYVVQLLNETISNIKRKAH